MALSCAVMIWWYQTILSFIVQCSLWFLHSLCCVKPKHTKTKISTNSTDPIHWWFLARNAITVQIKLRCIQGLDGTLQTTGQPACNFELPYLLSYRYHRSKFTTRAYVNLSACKDVESKYIYAYQTILNPSHKCKYLQHWFSAIVVLYGIPDYN